jgi:hypothetical protein
MNVHIKDKEQYETDKICSLNLRRSGGRQAGNTLFKINKKEHASQSTQG